MKNVDNKFNYEDSNFPRDSYVMESIINKISDINTRLGEWTYEWLQSEFKRGQSLIDDINNGNNSNNNMIVCYNNNTTEKHIPRRNTAVTIPL